MKVLVLSNMAPFVHGGAEELCHHLVRNLRLAGAEAEAFRIPFAWDPAERILEEMVIARSLRLWNADRVIGLKFPAYLIPHPNKVLWLLHQYRQAYDLWDAGQSNLPYDERGEEIRRQVANSDNECFANARGLYAIAANTANRLRRSNGFEAEILMHPLNDPHLFVGEASEGYILASGRVGAAKRQEMLVRAMAHAGRNVRLVVAGPPDSAEDELRMRRLVAELGLEDRVTLDLRFLPRQELADLTNRALAVAYVPFDEDSIGYCTMEAMHASKAVLTVTDSGGVQAALTDRSTGFVVEPDPERLGAAMSWIADHAAEVEAVGRTGRAHWLAQGANWPKVVERLLS